MSPPSANPRPIQELLRARPRITFMDCDGIIFDTNASKCDAFRHALSPYPADAVETLVSHHKATGGVSRYVKLKYFFDRLHPVPDPDAAIAEALERFSAFSEAAYGRLSPLPESLEFAARLGGPERVHVVSGSDGDELRRVFSARALDARFASVLGSPETKVAHLGRLLAAAGSPPEEALFIGDGGGDWDAAASLGIPFILLTQLSEWREGPTTLAASVAPPAAIASTWAEVLAAFTAT